MVTSHLLKVCELMWIKSQAAALIHNWSTSRTQRTDSGSEIGNAFLLLLLLLSYADDLSSLIYFKLKQIGYWKLTHGNKLFKILIWYLRYNVFIHTYRFKTLTFFFFFNFSVNFFICCWKYLIYRTLYLSLVVIPHLLVPNRIFYLFNCFL